MEKIGCSVPILTLNSEKFLRRCLDSIKNFSDVYLVDGNSTDQTLIIAKEYSLPVYKQVETDEKNIKIKNFTEARVKSVSLVKTDWIFFLDSDEYVSPELNLEIAKLLVTNPDKNTAFNVQKKYCIGDRKFEFAFNYPNYYLRLYHRNSGVGFKSGKLVHEQMEAPHWVKVVNLKNCVYSEVSPTYRECVRKDDFQLGLMKQSTFAPGAFKSRWHSLRVAWRYFLRAGNILYKSIKIYFKHGFKNSLPIGQVMRHVRVHLIMSGWRLIQVFMGISSTRNYAK